MLKKTGIKYFGVSYGKYADTQQVFLLSLSSIRCILFYKGTRGRNKERNSPGREVLCYRAQISNMAPGMYVIRFIIKGTAILDDSVMHRQPVR